MAGRYYTCARLGCAEDGRWRVMVEFGRNSSIDWMDLHLAYCTEHRDSSSMLDILRDLGMAYMLRVTQGHGFQVSNRSEWRLRWRQEAA